MWNLSDSSAECVLSFPLKVHEAFRVTHIETDQGPLEVRGGGVVLPLAGSQLQSLRVVLTAGRD